MNATQISETKNKEVRAAERNIAATRAKYLEGETTFDAVTEAEKVFAKAQKEAQAASEAARQEKAQFEEEARAQAVEDAKRAREAAVAAERKRLAELDAVPEIELVTAEDERELADAARILVAVASRYSARASARAKVVRERRELKAKIASILGEPKVDLGSSVLPELLNDASMKCGALFAAMHSELLRFEPTTPRPVRLDMRPLDDRRARRALGIEREMNADELAAIAAAEERARAAGAVAAVTATKVTEMRNELGERARKSPAFKAAVEANEDAQAANREAQAAVGRLRREIAARLQVMTNKGERR